MNLVEKILNKDRRAIARMITWIENNELEADENLRQIYPYSGHAYRIGITGPPGAGKSTLTDKLVKLARKTGERVAVIAVDPTSPFSGGAILGDRVRMGDLTTDPDVFIRSMGSRGHLGGLSEATTAAATVLDAAGYRWIFIETVGVGQSEVDIAGHCDTTLMVCVPGLGDEIQAMKAGVLEIGDVFTVNKSDLDGAKKMLRELEMMLDFTDCDWRPTVHSIVARDNIGIESLWEGLLTHRSWQETSGTLEKRRRANCRIDLLERIQNNLIREMQAKTIIEQQLEEMISALYNRAIDPYSASEKLLKLYRQHEQHEG